MTTTKSGSKLLINSSTTHVKYMHTKYYKREEYECEDKGTARSIDDWGNPVAHGFFVCVYDYL